jgi:hypothetical protein
MPHEPSQPGSIGQDDSRPQVRKWFFINTLSIPSMATKPIPASPKSPDHIEWLIDEALAETFPASDPPAPAVGPGEPIPAEVPGEPIPAEVPASATRRKRRGDAA